MSGDCRSRARARPSVRIRLALIVLVAFVLFAAAALAAVPSGKYHGQTSQGRNASLKISHGAIHHFVIRWNARCSMTHRTVTNTTTFRRLSLHGSSFRVKVRAVGTVAKGYSGHFTTAVRGSFVTTRVRGSFTGTMDVYKASSQTLVDVCKSGKFTFALHR